MVSMLAVQRASCFANAAVVAGLGGGHEVDRDEDVLLEQLGQARTCGIAVVAGDRGTDVLLVLEQSTGGGVGVGRPGDGGDDVLAGPDDVIRPELAECESDGFSGSRHVIHLVSWPSRPCNVNVR